MPFTTIPVLVLKAIRHCGFHWTMGYDGYFTYRIPCICVTPSGSVLAFAEARKSDFTKAWGWSKNWNADMLHCVMKRSTDGGKTWSAQTSILECEINYEARDPAPVVDRETGDLFLVTRGPYVMKKEYDFSKGNRGKFYRPNAKLNVPVYLDRKVMQCVEHIAERKQTDVSSVVNRLLLSDMELVEAAR